MSILGPNGATAGIGLFTGAQVASIRYYCGYGSYAAYGYVLAGSGMAVLDTQMGLMVASEVANVTAILTALTPLETALQNASTTLNVDTAAVFKRNANEMAERHALFDYYRHRLCELFNVPPGPALKSGNRVVRC
ncbi:MAG TPA: hypothetical protein PLT25_06255 [Acidocella sp.]|nr:hypothetical protein [Acidocella sp.]